MNEEDCGVNVNKPIKINNKVGDSMLEKIKASCNYVTENSRYVSINYKKLDEYIKTIDCKKIKFWLSSNPYNLFDMEIDKIINFMLLFDSIDYCFWGQPKWTIETIEGKKDGSDALLYSLLNYVKNLDNIDFTNVSFEDFSNILKGNVEIPFLRERYNTVVSICNVVNERMNGNFYNYVKEINNDTELFDIIISNFRDFCDEREYDSEKIYFYKLAQLLTSDILHIKELINGTKVDYSHLVGCADYKIPQTLRALGILEFNTELSEIVNNKQLIDENSKYEVEIRANMISVINYINSKLENSCSIDINDYLFLSSKSVKDIAKPYHLCRNKNY